MSHNDTLQMFLCTLGNVDPVGVSCFLGKMSNLITSIVIKFGSMIVCCLQ